MQFDKSNIEPFFLKLVEQYRDYFQNAESAIPGANGPYQQKETFVRNTAHWMVSFSIMFQLTGDNRYWDILARFSSSILEEVNRSKNGAICCIPESNSSTNGLIGLAWVIEGLVSAYEVLKDKNLLDAAEKIFFSQPYSERLHTWMVVNTEGKNLGADIAFNHSLWFCFAGARITRTRNNGEINKQIDDYLEHIESHFSIYKSGLLSHFDIRTGNWVRDYKFRIRKMICAATGRGIPTKKRNDVEYERAYMLFSMYAFAWLYRFYPAAKIFRSSKFLKMRQYSLDMRNFKVFPEMNQYAYGYNSPAYELPFVEYVFGERDGKEYLKECLALHKKYNDSQNGKRYSDNVPDPETLNARVYEIMQYYYVLEIDRNGAK